MRIVSEFKDYYDCIQAMGQDRSLVFVRKPKEVDYSWKGINSPVYPFPVFSGYYGAVYYKGRKHDDFIVDNYTVGFCGRLYPVIETSMWVSGEGRRSAFCYSLEEIDAFVEGNYKQKWIDGYYTKKWEWGKTCWQHGCRRTEFEKFFEKYKEYASKYERYFLENHAPVFLGTYKSGNGGEKKVVYGGCLKEVEFYRIYDPYMAFQEISMYLGSMAVPQKPMPEISDEVMAEIKGFDRWSFRKEPSKRK